MKALGHQKLDVIKRNNPAYESVMSEILKDTGTSESSTRISKGEVRDWLRSLQGLKTPRENFKRSFKKLAKIHGAGFVELVAEILDC